MKELTGIRLINWHYFVNETIRIRGSTLITGDNGSGKSTILDALQYVLVADLRKIRFNVSAFDETRRDLLGYVRCKTGRDTESGRKYEQQGDITSYVVLEFYDTVKRSPFLLGAVIDSYADDTTYDSRFFKIEDCRLDDDLFLIGKRPRNIREFRMAVRERKATIYTTVEKYQADLLQKLGSLGERFFSLFVKAISFKPITDIRQFVYSYVLEEKQINIDIMRENLQRYKEYSDLAAQTREKITALENIREKYLEIQRDRERALLQDYLILRATRDRVGADLQANLDQIRSLEEELARLAEALEGAKGQLKKCREEERAYRDALAANATFQLVERLQKEIGNLREQVQELSRTGARVTQRAREECRELDRLLQEAGEELITPEERELFAGLLAGLQGLAGDAGRAAAPTGGRGEPAAPPESPSPAPDGRTAPPAPGEDPAALARLIDRGRETLAAVRERVQERMWEINRQLKELAQEETALQRELASLRNKKHIYDRKVTELRDLIREKFRSVKGLEVEPQVLCELLEVPDEKWQDAVEGWLNTRRFDLIVEPEHFDYALAVYEKHKKERRISGVGLVNTGRVLKYLNRIEPGSLAAEVTSDNRYALAYIHQLMGDLIKCENEQELKNHRRAITPTCMTYSNHTARQIKFEVYETPFIGQRAYARQIARKEARLQEIAAARRELLPRLKSLEGLARRCGGRDEHYIFLKEHRGIWLDLAARQQDLAARERELAGVDTAGFAALQQKLLELEREMDALNGRVEKYTGRQGEIKNALEQQNNQRAVLEKEHARAQDDFEQFCALYPRLLEEGEKRYAREIRRHSPGEIAANFTHNRKSVETMILNKEKDLLLLKTEYNNKYQFGGRVEAGEHEEWEAEYKKLVESELPAYEEKIDRARREAEEEFKEHFIYKLRENIQNARVEFDFLNEALKDISFGGDRYRFLVGPAEKHQKFYQMLEDTEMVEGGVSLFDSVFQQRHREALDELFDKIINLPPRYLPESIAEYTDYRSFLDYDIRITHANGDTSTFSKVCREKSGGETQTPYYVAIVASFAQLYRAKTNRDSIRLILFDEAFNRMDMDRVENSLRFINEMGMQAIIAAPTDKCEFISPHVPTTLLVVRDGRGSWIEDYKQLREAMAAREPEMVERAAG
ncbi:MAG: AAA family ATPase [Thermoanaerobacteraceae bacterium]|nr:AAA family ATPase [Thermoanaerobacteraceae bacterium]